MIFGDVHLNYNNKLSNNADLWPFTYVNKGKKGYIFWSKAKKSHLSMPDDLFRMQNDSFII